MANNDIPEGFDLFPLDQSFNDAIAPLYLALTDEGPKVALKVAAQHLNGMGICHGAVYMTMLDIAFASKVGHAIGKYTGTPTINININYMAASKEGEWLFVDAQCQKTTRTMGFVQGVIRSDSEVKVSGSGIFKIPSDIDAAPGITVEELKRTRAD